MHVRLSSMSLERSPGGVSERAHYARVLAATRVRGVCSAGGEGGFSQAVKY